MIFIFTLLFSIQFEKVNLDSLNLLSDEELTEIFIKKQSEDESVNLNELLEKIEYYRTNKISFRKATEIELTSLPGITTEVIEYILILQQRSEVTKNEFIQSSSVERFTLLLLSQYFKFDNESEATIYKLRQRVITKTQYLDSGNEENYNGSLYSNYHRLSVQSGKLSIGGMFERDAGELLKNGNSAFYIQLKNYYPIQKLVIGNYSTRVGQGLFISTNPQFGFSTSSIKSLLGNDELFRGSASTNELFMLRGSAIELNYNRFNLGLLYSNKNLSASIDTSQKVKSIYESGLFRTENELSKLNMLKEEIAGLVFTYSLSSKSQIGIASRITTFTKPLINNYLNNEDIQKNIYHTLFTNYDFDKGKILIDVSGENNIFTNKIFSFQVDPIKKFTIIYQYRKYNDIYRQRYISLLTAQSSITKQEEGYYYAFEFRNPEKVAIIGFADQFNIYEENYTYTNGSILGVRVLPLFINDNIIIEWKRKKLNYISSKTLPSELSSSEIGESESNKLRIQLLNKFRKINIINKLDLLKINKSLNLSENSFLLSTEVEYHPDNNFKLESRVTIYHTKSYDSRMWELESNGKGYMYFSQLYGDGIKLSFLVNYIFLKNINLSFKYSTNSFTKELEIYKLPIKMNDEIILQLDFVNN